MMSKEQRATVQATERKIAATLIYEARLKDYEAALWVGLPKSVAEAQAAIHSALDAVLDATGVQIRASKEQYGSGQ